MIQGLIKQGSRYIISVVGEMRRLGKREISFSQFREECARHGTVAWNDLNRPPVSDRHKLAIHCLNQGIRLYNAKRYSEALRTFEESLDYDPQYSRAHLYYGNAQYKLRNYEEALASWQCILRIDPKSDIAEKAREKLEIVQSKNQQAVREIQEQLKRV